MLLPEPVPAMGLAEYLDVQEMVLLEASAVLAGTLVVGFSEVLVGSDVVESACSRCAFEVPSASFLPEASTLDLCAPEAGRCEALFAAAIIESNESRKDDPEDSAVCDALLLAGAVAWAAVCASIWFATFTPGIKASAVPKPESFLAAHNMHEISGLKRWLFSWANPATRQWEAFAGLGVGNGCRVGREMVHSRALRIAPANARGCQGRNPKQVATVTHSGMVS